MVNYQWYRWNVPVSGTISVDYVVKNKGRYKCIAQNVTLCSDTSNVIIVRVPCIPIGPNHERDISNNELETFQITPNPGTGLFQIQSPPGQLQIFNSLGQMILSTEILEKETEIDISNHTDGIYLLKLKNKETVFSKKIILSH